MWSSSQKTFITPKIHMHARTLTHGGLLMHLSTSGYTRQQANIKKNRSQEVMLIMGHPGLVGKAEPVARFLYHSLVPMDKLMKSLS